MSSCAITHYQNHWINLKKSIVERQITSVKFISILSLWVKNAEHVNPKAIAIHFLERQSSKE